jgi:dTDP-4-dehydrorhamnose reductase
MTAAPLRALVVGAAGQLGADLMAVLGPSARGLTRADVDVTDGGAVRRAVGDWALDVRDLTGPRVVFNAAAWTDVDAAEDDEDAAYAANAVAPAHLAVAAANVDARFVHVSTDYVFPGDATAPYEPTDAVGPRSAYGRTKLAGEAAALSVTGDAYVVRTAWVYGATGRNFVKTMLRLERERDTVSVVDDQRGSPTWSADLARGLVELGSFDVPAGVYHCTNGGDTTWFEFTRAVFAELGADPSRVLPTTSDAFPRPAPRPSYSVLSDEAWRKAGLTPLPQWRDALHAAFAESADAFRPPPAQGAS